MFGFLVTGLNLEPAGIHCRRRFNPIQSVQQHAEGLVDRNQRRIEIQCGLVAFRSALQVTLPAKCDPKVQVGLRCIRIDTNGFAKRLHRFIGDVVLEEHAAEIVQRSRVIGEHVQRTTDQLYGSPGVATLVCKYAKIVKGIRVPRLHLEHPLVELLRLRQPLCLMVTLPFRHQAIYIAGRMLALLTSHRTGIGVSCMSPRLRQRLRRCPLLPRIECDLAWSWGPSS